jgi:surfactin synthase thioesterase subunit
MTALRVIGFPFAGGSAFSYTKIARELPAGATLTTLDPPGHGRRMAQPLLTDIGAIAVDLAPRVVQEVADTPYVLFGHSMGAYLAVAVLDRVAALGAALPARLVLSGAAPPQRPPPERIWELPADRFIERIVALGGMPSAVMESAELLELFTPILRADFEAAAGYRDARCRELPVPVVVLRGREDRMAQWAGGSWAACFRGGAQTLDLPGGHFFLFEQPHAVAAALCGGLSSIAADARNA